MSYTVCLFVSVADAFYGSQGMSNFVFLDRIYSLYIDSGAGVTADQVACKCEKNFELKLYINALREYATFHLKTKRNPIFLSPFTQVSEKN